MDMRNKYYIDNITGRVLTDSLQCPDFLISLTYLINMSLSTGIFPNHFKTSTVTPIQKVKSSLNASDLRPINTLCVISQLLEKIVKDQLLDHFEFNNLFCPHQSGFRKAHSCESALNNVLADWKESLDQNYVVIAIFIDLKRAFETIDRTLLLQKLAFYSCDSTVLSWFGSYLSNRYQQTCFKGHISTTLPTLYGIPQGSVLSCLLFIIFINDLPNILQFVNVNLFADDTLLYMKCKAEDIDSSIDLFNSDLNSLFNWLCFSKLAINTSKTKAMIISSRKNFAVMNHLKVNNIDIEFVQTMKYLGIIIDSSLSFCNHYESLLKKLNVKYFVFKRCNPKLNFESKKLYVNSIVLPHLHYCPTILFLLNDSQINELQKVLNRFMRLILRVDYRTPRIDMLNNLNWMSVKQHIHLDVILFIHRIAVGNAPAYLKQHMTHISDAHRYPTRGNDGFILKNFKKTSSQNSLFYNGLKLYNQFCEFRKSSDEVVRMSIKMSASNFVKQKFPLS
jgi:hypothetical protein